MTAAPRHAPGETASKTSPDVDAYIAAQPEAVRPLLEQVRTTVRLAAPDATEVISYRIPALLWQSRPRRALHRRACRDEDHAGAARSRGRLQSGALGKACRSAWAMAASSSAAASSRC